jgi:hypothetical protein
MGWTLRDLEEHETDKTEGRERDVSDPLPEPGHKHSKEPEKHRSSSREKHIDPDLSDPKVSIPQERKPVDHRNEGVPN